HLLHEALRRHLGEHVTQKGSLVSPDRLRFDISHPKGLSPEEIAVVEADVNAQVQANNDVLTRLMDPESAVEAGALALFGEKYGDEVRVVSMGAPEGDKFFSTELCGGTHVRRTGDIGVFKIIGEGAVAAGVRRIEAVTADGARAYFDAHEKALAEAAAALKVKPEDVAGRVVSLLDERKKLERELADARKKLALGGGGGAAAGNGGGGGDVKDLGGIKFAPRLLEDVPAKELKGMADELKKTLGSGVVALVSVTEGKANVVVGVTEDLVERMSAVDLVRAGSAAVGGKGGGGRPDMAQAGGPDGAQAGKVIDAIEAAIQN
ncbi:MAG TPA: alanine--tRNA ligase, partial [Rhodospirillaceae bacterium]|nr:alanine--tRNA ligase [Rhodospirillaceae bacterium]